MESSGDPMRVQVSQATKALLTRFIVEERGTFTVKVGIWLVHTICIYSIFREKAK